MLSAITDGSLASSPRILSAGGHDEHPCEVNSSITARGSAWAGRTMAIIAQTPNAPDHREIELRVIELWAIIAVIPVTEIHPHRRASILWSSLSAHPAFERKEGGPFIGRLPPTCYSLRGEPPITTCITPPVCAARIAGCRRS